MCYSTDNLCLTGIRVGEEEESNEAGNEVDGTDSRVNNTGPVQPPGSAQQQQETQSSSDPSATAVLSSSAPEMEACWQEVKPRRKENRTTKAMPQKAEEEPVSFNFMFIYNPRLFIGCINLASP